MSEADASTASTAVTSSTSTAIRSREWAIGTELWVYWRGYANKPGADRWMEAVVVGSKENDVLCRYADDSVLWCSAASCVRRTQIEECDKELYANAAAQTDEELNAAIADAQRQTRGRLTLAQEVYERMASRFASTTPSASTTVSSNVTTMANSSPSSVDLRVFELAAARVPAHCVPICGDVRTLDWPAIIAASGGQFDAILMDPPWKLASAQPTRGVAIGYSYLSDAAIEELPVQSLAREGFLFVWVINSKYTAGIRLMQKWGYRLVDDIAWVKETVNRRLAKSHGYYLQHAKESCLVGIKGSPRAAVSIASDVIFAGRRGQSQKPDAIYELIEQLVPNGQYLEIFARRNNLRNGWVSIGNEL